MWVFWDFGFYRFLDSKDFDFIDLVDFGGFDSYPNHTP